MQFAQVLLFLARVRIHFVNSRMLQNLELNNLNHIEFNPTLTLTTLFPQKISRLPASKSLYLGNIARRILYL